MRCYTKGIFPDDKAVLYMNWGRTALQVVIELESLHGSTVILPAFICQDSFEPLFSKYELRPKFVDISPPSFHLDREEVRGYLDDASALIFVHAFGLPKRLKRLAEACNRHDVVLIEDCARAIGARTSEGPVGRTGKHAIYSLSKTTPLSMGGVLATDVHPDRVELHPPSYGGRAFYNVAPKKLREQFRTTYPVEIQPRRLDYLSRIAFHRFLNSELEEQRQAHRRRVRQLQRKLRPFGFSFQTDTRGRVYPTAPLIVPSDCDRDGLLHFLSSKQIPAKVTWGHPWAKSVLGDEFSEAFPNAAMLSDQLLHLLISHMNPIELTEVIDHIQWYVEEFRAG